jgi:hypothetical protein
MCPWMSSASKSLQAYRLLHARRWHVDISVFRGRVDLHSIHSILVASLSLPFYFSSDGLNRLAPLDKQKSLEMVHVNRWKKIKLSPKTLLGLGYINSK